MPIKYSLFQVLNGQMSLNRLKIKIAQIQHFEADFLWKVSLKILNSGIILKTLTHVIICRIQYFGADYHLKILNPEIILITFTHENMA